MNKLPKTFRKFGDTFQLIKRTKEYAIFKRFNINGSLGYEVIKVLKQIDRINEFNPSGTNKLIEKYPSSEQFGFTGWYFETYHSALSNFEQLGGQNEK